MKTIAVVQARMGSVRLPRKVMRPINGVPLIELLIERLKRSKTIDEIVVATSTEPVNLPLVEYLQGLPVACVQGSEHDVLERFLQAAETHRADVVVRITGDCPLVDPSLVDRVVTRFRDEGVDYAGNADPPTYPDGLDVEVFTTAALRRAARETRDRFDREHVTPYLRRSEQFRRITVQNPTDHSNLRWTVDEPEDLEVITAVFSHFAPDRHFSWEQVLELHVQSPELFAANGEIQRNAGASMGTGQKLWQRAKQVIPGGNMLLSKRAEMFLPQRWPAYFSKASGCRVWDLDGNEFSDVCIMGIGTNTLGYGRPEVDDAVRRVVDTGNMATFNCPEEVLLAERLIELHPWADMVRFARSGGEANAIAIRIARAACGKDKVAVCGYHGWHDWYLSANLGDDSSLAGHLLPGLEPKGVPGNLRGTVYPFAYNDFDGLRQLVDEHDIGSIKMEVARNKGPENDFLQRVRQLATQRGIVLIFDECTSGFRQAFGGLHKIYGVEPDMAVFGKALGNGYAITAAIGRREIMESAQATFISSTFWTERIGPAAALKTLEVMEQLRSWEVITDIGLKIRGRWQQLADRHGLKIEHWGIPALTGFSFCSDNHLAYKTLITQEMLDRGYLAGNSVYVCTEHSDAVLEGYFDALDPVFGLIRRCEDGEDVGSFLKGPICHGGFKRLN